MVPRLCLNTSIPETVRRTDIQAEMGPRAPDQAVHLRGDGGAVICRAGTRESASPTLQYSTSAPGADVLVSDPGDRQRWSATFPRVGRDGHGSENCRARGGSRPVSARAPPRLELRRGGDRARAPRDGERASARAPPCSAIVSPRAPRYGESVIVTSWLPGRTGAIRIWSGETSRERAVLLTSQRADGLSAQITRARCRSPRA